jgi:hypothetical protein
MNSTPNTSPTSWLTILSGVRVYHKKILVGKLATLIEQEICRICEANTWTIGALHMQADHVHLVLNAPPNVSPSRDGLTRSKSPLPARSFNASLK